MTDENKCSILEKKILPTILGLVFRMGRYRRMKTKKKHRFGSILWKGEYIKDYQVVKTTISWACM